MTYRVRQLILLVGDLICLYFGLRLATFVRNPIIASKALSDLAEPMFGLFLIALLVLYVAGVYDITRAKNSWNFYQRLLVSSVVWVIVGVGFFYFQSYKDITPKTILALTTLFGFGLIAIWRFFHNKFLTHVISKTNLVFAGLTQEALELILFINKTPALGYKVMGLVEEDEHNPLFAKITGVTVVKDLAQLKNKLPEESIHLIIIGHTQQNNNKLLNELYQNLFKQIEIVEEADFYGEIMGRIPPTTFSEAWFLTNLHEQRKKVYDRIKILIDYLVAAIISIFFVITFPFIALLIKINSRGSVFYKQERIGRHGKTFKIYKYRTMQVLNADGSAEIAGPQWAKNKDQRITLVGKFLRSTRLDEVPQFINILRGEMSLIGPRPERPSFVEQLKEKMPFYDLRHLVKPGLTGWAQLHESYYGTMEENLRKLEYDLYYIKNRSWLLDLIILLKTINVLIGMMGR